MSQTKLCIIAPAYNEEKTIEEFLKGLHSSGYPFIVVDDGSTDGTRDIVARCCPFFIGGEVNQGKGQAIKMGAYCAIKLGYEYILIMDTDGQNKVDDISVFELALKRHPDAKIIIGNRLRNPKEMPYIRLLTNKFMSWLVSILSGTIIRDSQCGYRLIHKDVFDLDLKSNRFEFESEMLIKAGKVGFKIVSVPVQCVYKEERISKIHPVKDAIRFIKMVWRILNV